MRSYRIVLLSALIAGPLALAACPPTTTTSGSNDDDDGATDTPTDDTPTPTATPEPSPTPTPTPTPQAGSTWYTLTKDADSLHTIDPATAATLSTVTVTLSGVTIAGFNGLTVDDAGTLMAILRDDAAARHLVTINPASGEATLVGALPDQVASIAWATSVLYGVVGDGGATANILVEISTADATFGTQIGTLGSGNDGEALTYDPTTNLLMHASGRLGGDIWESVNRIGAVTTDIGRTSADPNIDEEIMDCAYNAAGSNFLCTNLDSELWSIDATGAAALIGTLDHFARGITFGP